MSDGLVTVREADLRLLLDRAGPLLVSPETRTDPVVDAIDRLGDACLIARSAPQSETRKAV